MGALLSRFSTNSPHFFAFVHLEGRWLLVDPSDDLQLAFGGQHALHTLQPVYFDGKSDAMLRINPEDVLEHWDRSKMPLQNVDNYLRKKNKSSSTGVQLLNLALEYIRLHGRHVKDLHPAQQFAGCMRFVFLNYCGLGLGSAVDSVLLR